MQAIYRLIEKISDLIFYSKLTIAMDLQYNGFRDLT